MPDNYFGSPVLTALPLFPIEDDHDTVADAERAKVHRRPRLVRARPETPRAEVREIHSLPPPKRPVSQEEQLRRASVSAVLIREAVVKRMSSPKPAPIPEFRVAEVRIDWLRCGARGMKIIRDGSDGFIIEGAAQETARISVGIEGLIFSVAVAAKESAATVLERLAKRLSLGYSVKIVQSTEGRASAVLTCHT